MIVIQEDITEKLPGLTSLFVVFNYDEKIVKELKALDVARFNKNTKQWEVPVTSLAQLLDALTPLDDIKLILHTEKTVKPKVFQLQDYKTKPFGYQIDGIQFGLNHNRWLLLDEAGLGKTLQIIYLAQELRIRENIKHCLIVCGVNTLKYNWKNEIAKHSNLSCRILGEKVSSRGNCSIGDTKEKIQQLKHNIDEFFIITNVETLRDDTITKLINSPKSDIDMIVVDEIHCCKSSTSQQGKHLLTLTKARYRVGMTGTLLMNSPIDAYVPLKWIGADRATYTNFKWYYQVFSGDFNNEFMGYRNTQVLKNQLDLFSIRRNKELLNLPPKIIIPEYVEMEKAQSTFYKNIVAGVIDQVDKVKMTTSSLLAMVTRLREATALPSILTSDKIDSSKVSRACDLVEQIVSNGDKVLVYSTFKDTVYELARRLEKYKPLVCTGDEKDETIFNNMELFQNDTEHKVFLATWAKCGTGLTLTKASYAIFIDTPWTDAMFSQACDRIHRIGTTDTVFIYNLITRGTIDERVYQILCDKKAISEYILDGKIDTSTESALRKYVEELRYNQN